MMDWDKLRIFHEVAAAGSFTRAGETLNLSQSAVSRQIGALEESLGITLFHRHARGLLLTEQGELLFDTVHDVFAKLAMTEALLNESKDRPKGHLRVTSTVALASTWLAPRLHEFLDLYPDIRISVLADEGELDLGMREADCAIRLGPPRQSDLIQRHLMTVHMHIYAAPEYLERMGVPEQVEDLDRHRLITYGTDRKPPVPTINWLLTAGARGPLPRQPVLEVNNVYAIYRAVRNGSGLAALPDYMVQERPGLVRVLPNIEGPTIDAYFVYPQELRNSARIKAFRDFLLSKIPETAF